MVNTTLSGDLQSVFIIGFLTASYLLVAVIAATMTYYEQRENGSNSVLFRTLGFLACAVWPLTFLTVAVAAQRTAPSKAC